MRMNRYNDEKMSPETVNYTETIRTVKRIQYKLPVTAPPVLAVGLRYGEKKSYYRGVIQQSDMLGTITTAGNMIHSSNDNSPTTD